MNRIARVVASCAVLAATTFITAPSQASQNGPFEWLNTQVSGFNARPQSAQFLSCFNEVWGGIRNDCSQNVTVTLPTSVTFPANGFTSESYLELYPARSSAYSCIALYVFNSNAGTTNTGGNISYWSSGWTTANELGVYAGLIPGDVFLACQMPPGESLDNVYITGTNNPQTPPN